MTVQPVPPLVPASIPADVPIAAESIEQSTLPPATGRRGGRMGLATILIVVLAVILLIAAFRGADWPGMLATFQKGRLDLLALSFLTLIVSYFLRGMRWQVLLSAEKPVALPIAFWATAIGYLGNGVLPARAGEVIRSVLIARKTALSISFVLATALTERVLDALAVVLFGSVALLVVGSIPAWLLRAAEVVAVLGILGVGVFYILPRLETLIARLINRLPLPERLKMPIVRLVRDFLTGLRAIHALPRLLGFSGLTIAIWATDALCALLVAWSFGLAISLPQMIILLAAMGLASAAPSTPGYIGIYQFVAVTVLVPFGLTQSQALVFILAFQAVSYLVVFVTGGLGLWRLHAFGRLSTLATEIPPTPVDAR